MKIFLFETAVAVDEAGTMEAIRWASGGDGYNHPTAPAPYEPRLLQAAAYRRDIFGAGRIGGGSDVGGGGIEVRNDDHKLDRLLDAGWAGQPFRILVGDPRGPYSAFQPLMSGVAEQPTPSRVKLSIRLRDQEQLFAKPVCSSRYAGTNGGPLGVEGLENDLKGQRKSVLVGAVSNISPTRVATLPIYQANDGAIADWPGFYADGAVWGRKPNYASVAEMIANPPAEGYYASCLVGGYARAGSEPLGAVTADVVEGATLADRTAAQLSKRLVLKSGLVAPGLIEAADIALLDALQPAELGLHITDETSYSAALDRIAETIGGWRGFDRLGRWRIARLDAPAGPPVATFQLFERGASAPLGVLPLLDLDPRPAAVPAWASRLAFDHNPNVIEKPAASVTDDERKAWLRTAWRWASATNESILAQHPGASELLFGDGYEVDAVGSRIPGPATLFRSRVVAEAENARRLALFGRRSRARATVALDEDTATAIDLARCIRLIHPLYNLSLGKLFVITGMEYDARRGVAILEVWG